MAPVLKPEKTRVVERVAASALDRRSLVRSGMAAAGAWSAGAALDAARDAAKAAESTAGPNERNANVVLAHGAWADGSSWSKVIVGLNAKGVKALAAPLPLTSLTNDIAALERTLERLDGPIILAAHAYAGGVIAGTRSEKVKGLVYVTALAPDEGETVAEVFYRAKPDPKAPKLAPDDQGLIWLPEEAFAAAFAPNATAEERVVLTAVQRPIAVQSISVKVGRPLWRDRPSWFLVAEQDRMILLETQLFMAERMKARVRAVSADHTPIISSPGAVVDVILEAIRETAEASRG
jgi:pimeloyl-ACP methyl ester carboxylesterase